MSKQQASTNGEQSCDELPELSSLLHKVSRNDCAAFKELYNRTSRYVFGIVLALLRSRELAEEVSQDVYVTLWQQSSRFDPEQGKALSWIAAIARHRAIDRLRAERSRSKMIDHDSSSEHEVGDPGHDIGSIEQIAVRGELSRLRPEYRRAITLAYYRGYSHGELSDVLGVPLGTAKSWVRRGLAELKVSLG